MLFISPEEQAAYRHMDAADLTGHIAAGIIERNAQRRWINSSNSDILSCWYNSTTRMKIASAISKISHEVDDYNQPHTMTAERLLVEKWNIFYTEYKGIIP